MSIRDTVKSILYRPYYNAYRNTLRKTLISMDEYIARYGCVAQCEKEKTDYKESSDVFLLGTDFADREIGTVNEITDAIKQRFSAFFLLHPEYKVAYADEITKEGVWVKPDWSPHRYLHGDYLGKVIAARRDFIESLMLDNVRRSTRDDILFHAGGFGDNKSCAIGHLAEPLDFTSFENAKKEKSESTPADRSIDNDTLSIIIPSKDNYELLSTCINSLKEEISDGLTEIIVVDNGSNEENKTKICRYLDSLKVNCKYIYNPEPFNFAQMCNRGGKAASGKLLLFLNDDIEAVNESKGFIKEMKSLALTPYTGAVGIKLLYPESESGKDIIQHIGIQAIPSGPVHRLQYLSDSEPHYDNRNKGVHNCLAVTGACLMIKQSVFRQMLGFSDSLAVAFNDVDLCYRLWEEGYYNVVLCDKYLLHHESVTRGKDTSEEKRNRLNKEYLKLTYSHFKTIGRDPFYSEWLQQSALSTDIVLADKRPYTDGNVQEADGTAKLYTKTEFDGMVDASKGKLREDACLYSKLLYYDENELYGFVTLTGSKNYTQKKSILLKKIGKNANDIQSITEIPITPYYGELVEVSKEEYGELSTFRIKFNEQKLNGNYIFGAKSTNIIGNAGVYHFTEQVIKLVSE